MIPGAPGKDLIVLAADKSMMLSLEALLARHKDLGTRPISCDVFSHPEFDSGVLRKCHSFLRPQCRRYQHAIAMCDRKGCGKETLTRDQLEAEIAQSLQANGWENRAAAVVIDLELEAWIWGDWNMLATFIRWKGGGASLKDFLIQQKLLRPGQAKPPHP
jgi:hypothetical protein